MQVRAASEEDTPFLVHLACAAYRDVVTRQFGGWDEDEQAARFADKVARLPFVVGELSGRPIAAAAASTHPDHVFLDELLVLPAFQGRGYGGHLLGREVRRARARGLPLRLHVLRLSRARSFYERHGFVVTGSGGVFVDLELAVPVASNASGTGLRPVA